MLDLLITNGDVYINGKFQNVNIGVKNGKITEIMDVSTVPQAEKYMDIKGQYLIPGTIDTHMHVRDPGHTERGNFYTETMAAAAGGVTTIIEHPISIPPQYNVEILENRIKRAEEQCVVDFAFYGAAGAEFTDQIVKLAEDGRIVAYKTFLHAAPEGRENEFRGLTMANDAELYKGLTELAKTGLMAAFHAENNDMIQENIKKCEAEGKVGYPYHYLSRPPITEITSVERVLNFAKITGAKVEIAHVSTPEAMELLKQAKAEGMDVYCETCPHYLFLSEEDVDRLGPFARCNPPLRSKEAAAALWEYVNDGTVDFIGSDHSPFLYEEKTKGLENIFKSACGFPGVDVRLPLMLDAVNSGKLTLECMVELLSENPAKCFGIYPQKGTIRIGSDADFTVFTMKEWTTVNKEKSYSHAKDIALPYDGKKLKGRITATIVRGRTLMRDGVVDENLKAYGKLVTPVKETVVR